MHSKKKLFFTLLLFLVIAIKSSSAQKSEPYKGIYVSNKWIKPVDEEVLQSKDVDGVHLRLRWLTLEPEQGKYDWTFLDSELKRIVAAGKKISIGIAAGKHTPEWVYEAGVPGLEFEEFRKQGKAQKFSAKIPVVWNQKFLELWTGFIKDFADHLKSMPEVYQNVTLIKLTGINETTLELRLPAQKEIENERGKSTDAPALWKSVGYRPKLILDAWDQILNAFQKNFGDKNVSIEIIPDKAFPLINDDGNETSDRSEVQNLLEQLIEKAYKKFKDKLVLQWDSLQEHARIPKFMEWCAKFNVPFGYQIAESEFGNPQCLQNNVPCDEEMLKDLFDRGNGAKGIFIEVFQKTVPAFPHAMAYGHEKFWK